MTTWIKLSHDNSPVWINSSQIRRIEAPTRYGKEGQWLVQIVFTSQDKVSVDQSFYEVMLALGYKSPAEPPLEVHETADELPDTATFTST